MATTAVPQVINGIISVLGASSALSGVRIFDGPEIDMSYPSDFIAVGHDGSEDGEVSVANVTQVFEQLGNMKQFEDGSVECFLSTWDGGTSLSARRTRAGVILSAVDSAIRADSTLAGSCIYSLLSSHQMTYLQTDQGAAVNISFTITYRART
jgi:hypothetical protein